MPIIAVDVRERVISLVASIILCTCIASSVSLIAHENIDRKASVRPLAPGGTDSIYGESVSSIFAAKTVRNTAVGRSSIRSNDQEPSTETGTDGTRELRAQSKSILDAKDGEEKDAELSAPSDPNLMTHSIALVGLTALGVSCTALVGFWILSTRSREHGLSYTGKGRGGNYIEIDIDGRRPLFTKSTSLGTEKALSL